MNSFLVNGFFSQQSSRGEHCSSDGRILRIRRNFSAKSHHFPAGRHNGRPYRLYQPVHSELPYDYFLLSLSNPLIFLPCHVRIPASPTTKLFSGCAFKRTLLPFSSSNNTHGSPIMIPPESNCCLSTTVTYSFLIGCAAVSASCFFLIIPYAIHKPIAAPQIATMKMNRSSILSTFLI